MSSVRKGKGRKVVGAKKGQAGSMAYRLKCAKTANGLSHFVMYGDVQKNRALL